MKIEELKQVAIKFVDTLQLDVKLVRVAHLHRCDEVLQVKDVITDIMACPDEYVDKYVALLNNCKSRDIYKEYENTLKYFKENKIQVMKTERIERIVNTICYFQPATTNFKVVAKSNDNFNSALSQLRSI